MGTHNSIKKAMYDILHSNTKVIEVNSIDDAIKQIKEDLENIKENKMGKNKKENVKKHKIDITDENGINNTHALYNAHKEDIELLSGDNPLGKFKEISLRINHFKDIGMDKVVTDSRSSVTGVTLFATDDKYAFLTSPLLTKPLSKRFKKGKRNRTYNKLIKLYLNIIKYSPIELNDLLYEKRLSFVGFKAHDQKTFYLSEYEDFSITETPTFDGENKVIGEDKYGTTILFETFDDFNKTQMFQELVRCRMQMLTVGEFILPEEMK